MEGKELASTEAFAGADAKGPLKKNQTLRQEGAQNCLSLRAFSDCDKKLELVNQLGSPIYSCYEVHIYIYIYHIIIHTYVYIYILIYINLVLYNIL